MPAVGQQPRRQILAVPPECPPCVHIGTTSGTDSDLSDPDLWILVDNSATVDNPVTREGDRPEGRPRRLSRPAVRGRSC